MRASVVIIVIIVAAIGLLYVLSHPGPPPPHFACYGVTTDDKEAARLRAEATVGDAQAQYKVGLMELYGRDGKPDEAKAKEWLEKAASQGNSGAQYRLGELYDHAFAGMRDSDKAIAFYRQSAELGNQDAMSRLSRLLGSSGLRNKGSTTPVDKEAAKRWEDRRFLASHGLMARNTSNLLPDQQQMETIRSKAEAGDSKAQYEMYLLYYKGIGVPEDEKLAQSWVEKSAAQDYGPAHWTLYLRTPAEDAAKRRAELERAVEQGEQYAISEYIFILANDGTPEGDKKALEMTVARAERDDPMAQFMLARRYINGKGVGKDYVTAYAWLTRAARHKDASNLDVSADCNEMAAALSVSDLKRAQQLSREWQSKK